MNRELAGKQYKQALERCTDENAGMSLREMMVLVVNNKKTTSILQQDYHIWLFIGLIIIVIQYMVFSINPKA